jgi:hypothetical protein
LAVVNFVDEESGVEQEIFFRNHGVADPVAVKVFLLLAVAV